MTRSSTKTPDATAVAVLSALSPGSRTQRRQNGKRLCWLFVSFGVLLTAIATGPPAVAQGAPAAPEIDLVHIDPWVPLGDELHIDIRTDGPADPSPTQVQVDVHVLLDSPKELANSLTRDEGPVIFRAIVEVDSLPEPEPGVRRIVLDISGTVNEGTTLRMAEPGVYPVVVTPIAADGSEGTSLRTLVIRLDHDDDPVSVALNAPDLGIILDVSTKTTVHESGRRELTADDDARFSRLATMVQEASGKETTAPTRPDDPPVPPFRLTVAATGDTLGALAESDLGGATALLRALVASVNRTVDSSGETEEPWPPLVDVVPLTTTAVHVPDLVRSGLERVVAELAIEGREAVEAEVNNVDTHSWLVSGRFDRTSAELVADLGYDRVVIPDNMLDGTGGEPAADRAVAAGTAVNGLPDGLDATVVDSETSEWLMRPLEVSGTRPDASAIAVSRLILGTTRPGTDLVVSVDDVLPESALRAALPLLVDPDSPIALRAVSGLGGRVDDDDEGDGGAVDGDAGVELSLHGDAATDDLESVAADVRTVRNELSILEDMMGDQAPSSEAHRLLAAAVASDTIPSGRRALVKAARERTSGILDKITFTGTSNLNITSRRSTLPILLENGNDFPITVALRADSERLEFPEGQTLTVDLPPGITRIDLPVRALASGSVPLRVELRDASGSEILSDQQFHVRSTAISGVGLLISFGAMLVLIVWWVRTWSSNRRRAPGVD